MRYFFLMLAPALLFAQPAQPVFATYLGGSGNEVVGSVTTDSQGNIYIAGRTDSQDFPVKNALQPLSKAYSQIFIAKFSPAGDLLYSTYFGGSANDLATAIAADPAGNVYVTGALQSHDFPVTNASQPQSGGAVDAFVLKLDRSGAIVYSTYLGGKNNDLGMAIAADAAGSVYVTGRTESPDFPVTPGAYQQRPRIYNPGYNFVDAFVTKLDAAGQLVYSTFLGGGDQDIGWAIAVDAAGQAHVAGETSSLNFPTTGNAFQPAAGRNVALGALTTDAFLAKLTADGSGLVYSTYLGGPSVDGARAIAIDATGNAYITGQTTDARLPIVNGAQPYLGGEVYRVSADRGNSFEPRRSGLAAAEVTAILFDPSIPSLVYAGTPQGVFRSFDGAGTWTPSGLDNPRIEKIVADPSRPGTLYAGTNYGGGLFRSADYGNTWTQLNAPFDTSHAIFRAIAVDPSGSGTIYALAGYEGTSNGDQPLYRITGGGTQWTLVGQGLQSTPLSLAMSSDSTLFAGTVSFNFFSFLGGFPHIPGTVNRRVGDTWAKSALDDDIGALAFQGGTLYAAGRSFYRSVDGGQTWSSSPLAGGGTVASDIEVDPANPATIYVLRGGVLRSDDGGQTFQVVNSQPFSSLAINPSDSSLHAGSAASADAYVAEFDPSGTLVYSTFIGNSSVERGDGVALGAAGQVYVAGFRSNPGLGYDGTTFVARASDPGNFVEIGATTTGTVLNTPSRGITIAPDGSIITVMIATQSGMPVRNEIQSNRKGDTDVYLVKWR